MKILMILLLITIYSCEDSNKTKEQTSKPNQAETSSIVEENDACICTKDWRPVCGDNGVTYPNACQAKCEKVNNYTEGPCSN